MRYEVEIKVGRYWQSAGEMESGGDPASVAYYIGRVKRINTVRVRPAGSRDKWMKFTGCISAGVGNPESKRAHYFER